MLYGSLKVRADPPSPNVKNPVGRRMYRLKFSVEDSFYSSFVHKDSEGYEVNPL